MSHSHWKIFAIEAAGLGMFVLGAGLITILMEHPSGLGMQSWLKDYPLPRRMPLGIVKGIYIFLFTLWAGKITGAHINPVITWTFFGLRRISFRNAVWYTFAQFTGAVAMAFLLKLMMGNWFSHPSINYGITAPKPQYNQLDAFVAELTITFIMVAMTLFFISNKKHEKKVPLITGILIMLYIIFELPFSGMSLNPARSFAGAAAGNQWEDLWIYFAAPSLAALFATSIFIFCENRWKVSPPENYKPLPYFPREREMKVLHKKPHLI